MPALDLPHLLRQHNQEAIPHEIPLATLAPSPGRLSDELPPYSREQYYGLPRPIPRKPWYYSRKFLMIGIVSAIISVFVGCVVLTVMVAHKIGDMSKSAANATITQADVTTLYGPETTYTTVTSFVGINGTRTLEFTSTTSTTLPSTRHSHLPSMTTMTTSRVLPATPSPLSPLSHLASAFVNTGFASDNWTLLIWQNGAGDLAYAHGPNDPNVRGFILDTLKHAPVPKNGTSLAATVEDSETAHLFYVDKNFTISHVYTESGDEWKLGSLSRYDKPIAILPESTLSAGWHEGEHNTKVVVISYQDPMGNLQLAMSESPKDDKKWHIVDFNSFTGAKEIGNWKNLGHSIAGDWQNPIEASDGPHIGLLMAVEAQGEAVAWECFVDFNSSAGKLVECHWLNGTFLDANGSGIALHSLTNQFSWARTGHGKGKSPAQTLPYEFAFLHVDSGGNVHEDRVGVDLPRTHGTGFNNRMKIDAVASTVDKVVYAKSGEDVVVFKLDVDGWEWSMDGIFNTSIPNGGKGY